MEGNLLYKVIEIGIAFFVLAIILPIGLIQLAGSQANMTSAGVSPVVITVVVILIPVLVALALVLYFIPKWK